MYPFSSSPTIATAQIEHVRPVVHQSLGQTQDLVVLLPLHQFAEMFDTRRRVHFLGDDQRLRFEVERNGGIRAGSRARTLDVALSRFHARDRIHNGLEMFRRSAATASDNADAVVLHKVLVILRQILPALSL